MPTVMRSEGLRFFFYSSDRAEPPHIHVEHGRRTAKIWLDPIRLEGSKGFGDTELYRVLKLVREKKKLMLRSWNGYFRHTD